MKPPVGAWPDWAHRASDVINLHVVCGHAGRWCAIRLSDGGSDGQVYDSRADAVRHQLHEQQAAYVKIPMDGASPAAMATFLRFHREMYDAGHRLVDPEKPNTEVIMPLSRELWRPIPARRS